MINEDISQHNPLHKYSVVGFLYKFLIINVTLPCNMP